MKTIHLNLAAKPYRNYRPVWVVVAIAILATLILLAYNAITAYDYLVDTEETRGRIAALEAETDDESSRSLELLERVQAIDLRALDQQSRFINKQIKERAFSFSVLLDRLEKVMPDDVRLLNLNPSIDDNGTVYLGLSCVARKRDGMVDFLNQLYEDDAFREAFPRSERSEDGLFKFSIEVQFLEEVAE